MNEQFRESKMIQDFPFFIWTTLGYALFYVLCIYKNGLGITYPIFTLGTMIFFIAWMKKFSVKVKPFSIIYMLLIELFGLSNCLTANYTIIFFNTCSIFFLIMVFLLHNFYDNKEWNFLDYIKAYFIATFVPIIYIWKPFYHSFQHKKGKVVTEKIRKNSKMLYVFIGLLISLPLVTIVLGLLLSADAVFMEFFRKIFNSITLWDIFSNGFLSSILFTIVFFTVYMLICFFSSFHISSSQKDRVGIEPIIAITVCAMLSFVYVIFCGIQVVYLFIGSVTEFILPVDMTYAQYAREGFFQLLFVCIFNLLLVLVGIYLFRESKILKALLSLITLCTYVMIASSAMRMLLYIQYKYLTFTRVFVLWALVVIFLVMLGVMISIFSKKFNLFRYITVVVMSLYLVLSFGRVDYFIAKVNVDNMKVETQYEFFKGTDVYDDPYYLFYDLSYDAAPVILGYEDDSDPDDYGTFNYRRENYIGNIIEDTEDLGIRNFNVSKAIAKYEAVHSEYYK